MPTLLLLSTRGHGAFMRRVIGKTSRGGAVPTLHTTYCNAGLESRRAHRDLGIGLRQPVRALENTDVVGKHHRLQVA
jgi:hypothetical protein